MRFSTLILAIPAVLVAATPAAEIKEPRAGSGCYAFEDPDCGIDYTVCSCANGWFYKYREHAKKGKQCDPPGAILAKKESGLHGYSC
ncbi:hypothetical protein HDV63DRAFT_403175 [Trichoderma sp. SZMC 28014]